jgi:outer membrane protein assembly factor BamB
MTPALWLVPEDGEREEGRCARLVNRLAASAVLPEGTIDANGFDLIQATDDGRLALVDPLLNLASANIKAILDVGGVPGAWAIDASGSTLMAAMPKERSLLLIDMARFAVVQRRVIEAAPNAVVASSDRFWVGTAEGTLLAFDPDKPDAAGSSPLPIGEGPVQVANAGAAIVALARSGEGAYVRSTGDMARFALGTAVTGLVYSPLADGAYALTLDGTGLFFVPQDDPGTPRRVALQRQMRSFVLSPDGRWLALVASDGEAVTVFDVAAGRERWTIAANDPVVAADFSDAFLYLAHKRRGGATRVVFDPSGGPPGTVTIAAGSIGETDNPVTKLPVMAHVPGAGMLVASTRDRAAYMINDDNAQAAMSSLPLRAGQPEGILLRYRGLVPTRARGDYAAEVMAPRGGRYLAVVRTDRPAIAHCAPLAVAPAPGEDATAVARSPAPVVRTLEAAGLLPPGRQRLRFAISGQPVRLVGAMLLGEGWQQTPPDIVSEEGAYAMPVDLTAGQGFTLFVRYRDDAGESILSTPVKVGRP